MVEQCDDTKCAADPASPRYCWACSIPQLVWLKIALLNGTVAY
jgi:hypothetical protein